MGAEQALGVQVGVGRACVLGVQGARAVGRAGRWGGRRWGAQGERSAGECAAGRDAGVGAQGGTGHGHGMDTRGAWLAHVGARRAAVWVCLCAQHGRAGWVSWAKLVHCAPGSVLTQFLDPDRVGIFPESLNEHCSL